MAVQQLRAVTGPCVDAVAKCLGGAIKRGIDFVTVTLPDPHTDYYKADGSRIVDAATKGLALQRETLARYQVRAHNLTRLAAGFATVFCLPFSDSAVRRVIGVVGIFGIFKAMQVARQKINAHYGAQISTLTDRINASSEKKAE